MPRWRLSWYGKPIIASSRLLTLTHFLAVHWGESGPPALRSVRELQAFGFTIERMDS